MKIAVLAHSRFPIREPFAGGLEMITCELVRELRRRGHDVTLFANAGSAPELKVAGYPDSRDLPAYLVDGELDAEELSMTEFTYLEQYAWAMADIARGGYDVIHNHTLHHLPVLLGEQFGSRFITTIHAPAGTRLKLAFRALPDRRQTVTCVSAHQSRFWEQLTRVDAVIHNGVNLANWQPKNRTEDYYFWMGRLSPEKAPCDAIQACLRAGKPLHLAGPIHDRAYFDRTIAPHLGSGLVTYLGHLTHAELAPRLAAAKALLFTSVFDEPYGLTMAESLAAGTPVIAYTAGASPEIVHPSVGRLVPKGDITGLAAAMESITFIDRAHCRSYARSNCSIFTMMDRYEALYRSVSARPGREEPVLSSATLPS